MFVDLVQPGIQHVHSRALDCDRTQVSHRRVLVERADNQARHLIQQVEFALRLFAKLEDGLMRRSEPQRILREQQDTLPMRTGLLLVLHHQRQLALSLHLQQQVLKLRRPATLQVDCHCDQRNQHRDHYRQQSQRSRRRPLIFLDRLPGDRCTSKQPLDHLAQTARQTRQACRHT